MFVVAFVSLLPSVAQATPITLQANVTTIYYFQPNVGANFGELVAPGAFFDVGSVRYDQFQVRSTGGPNAPSINDLWFLFNLNAQSPFVAVDPSIIGNGAFDVSWRLTAPDGQGFNRAQFSGTDFDSGTGDSGPSGTRVVDTVVGDGLLIGEQMFEISTGGGCQPFCRSATTLDFAPRHQLVVDLSVTVTGDARFTAAGVFVPPPVPLAPVPEPASRLLLGTGLLGVAAHRWRKSRKHRSTHAGR